MSWFPGQGGYGVSLTPSKSATRAATPTAPTQAKNDGSLIVRRLSNITTTADTLHRTHHRHTRLKDTTKATVVNSHIPLRRRPNRTRLKVTALLSTANLLQM